MEALKFFILHIVLSLSLNLNSDFNQELSTMSLEELVEFEDEVINIYEVTNNDELLISLARVNFFKASNYLELYKKTQDQYDLVLAIDYAEDAIELDPSQKFYSIFLGDLYYLIKDKDAFYIDAIIAYESSGNLLLSEKESALRLMEIYINDQQHLNAFTLCSRLMKYDAQWTLQNLMDIYISTAILSGSTQYSLEILEEIIKNIDHNPAELYLTKAYLHSIQPTQKNKLMAESALENFFIHSKASQDSNPLMQKKAEELKDFLSES
tara:strand:+ start:4877 stop:5677 length:801 start_codon:yes stop_codon:yes gene_type:complete